MTTQDSGGPDGLAENRDRTAAPQGWKALDAGDVQRLHELYYDPKVQVAEIARRFAVSGSTVMRRIAEMGWPSRRALRLQSCEALRTHGAAIRGAAIRGAAIRGGSADVDDAQMRRTVEAAVQRELAFVEAALDAEETSDAARERNARALHYLVRAMQGLQGLQAGQSRQADDRYADDRYADERPPRSIAELRDELAEKVARIQAGM